MSTQHLDQGMLNELREIMGDDFSDLVDMFLSESTKQMTLSRDLWKDGNFDGLRRSAHSLKGCCANIGALGLQALCADLENNARDQVADPIEALLGSIDQLLIQVHDEIRTLH